MLFGLCFMSSYLLKSNYYSLIYSSLTKYYCEGYDFMIDTLRWYNLFHPKKVQEMRQWRKLFMSFIATIYKRS